MRILSLILSCLFVCVGTAQARITVHDAWVRATTRAQKVSAVYAVLENEGPSTQTVVKAFSPVAARTVLQKHSMDTHGRMLMTALQEIDVPPRGVQVLQPGGVHIMLINLKYPLTVGLEVPVTVTFKDGTTQTFRAKVQPMSYHPMDGRINLD